MGLRARAAIAFTVLALCAAPTAGAAGGDGTIQIARAVPLAANIAPTHDLGNCPWDTELSRQIVKAARGRVVATSSDLAAVPGRTLVLEVRRMHVSAGGRFSQQASSILLHGELREGGRTIDAFDIRREWRKGWQGCTTAKKLGEFLAADVALWTADRDVPAPATQP